MNRLKLEQLLARRQRALRPLLIGAIGFTLIAVGDGLLAVEDGRPLIILLDMFCLTVAAFHWSSYLGVLSSISTLKVVQDAMDEQSQEESS